MVVALPALNHHVNGLTSPTSSSHAVGFLLDLRVRGFLDLFVFMEWILRSECGELLVFCGGGFLGLYLWVFLAVMC